MEVKSNFCPISARPDESWEGPILQTRGQKFAAFIAVVFLVAAIIF